ncbi:MAG: gamma-glutamyltransferase [Proteobacteria bacterium]|nr:gamma-glutamyltransferase [Pseudomonadota bacterium]
MGSHRRPAIAVACVLAAGSLAAAAAPLEHSGQYERYAVASDEAQASRIGASILRQGGSAADAAVATMLALGVTMPASSGLGGGGFALYYEAARDELTFLDFRERAPFGATPAMFTEAEARGLEHPSRVGGLASGIPGEPAGIAELLKRFGKLPRRRVTEPAARLAERGIQVSPYVARLSGFAGAELVRDPLARRWFAPGKKTLEPGRRLRRPALAKTIRSLGKWGARPFYRGPIARAIVRANRKAGGIFTRKDLADYRVVHRSPLEASHFGFRWVTAPPPSAGGYTLLASLALLERWLPQPDKATEAELQHALVESFKGPFLDRSRYFGDPDHVKVPLGELRAEAHVSRRAQLFRARQSRPASDYASPVRRRSSQPTLASEGGGTTHLCVVDAQGNVAAVTTTINLPFGARYTAAGMIMNDELDDFARAVGARNAFELEGGAPNLPGPGHRPVSTMTPTIAFGKEGPALCIGAAGGSRIVTGVAQTAFRVLVRNEPVASAVARPRIHHQGSPDVLRYEEQLDPEVVKQLGERGHKLEAGRWAAKVALVRIRTESPRLIAASDPRKGGRPAGR